MKQNKAISGQTNHNLKPYKRSSAKIGANLVYLNTPLLNSYTFNMPAKKTSKNKSRKKQVRKKTEKNDVQEDLQAETTNSLPEAPSKPQRIKKIRLEKIDIHSKKLRTTLIWLAIAVPTLLIGVYYYVQYINTKSELVRFKENPQTAAIYDLLEKVGTHIQLPKNETPTIATITDVDKLKGQPFFARAQNGDKILMYEKTQRTIIYRPLTDKIIETASISISNSKELTTDEIVNPEAKETTSSQEITEVENENPIRIVIYNGTGIPGLANSLQQKLNNDFDKFEFTIARVGNALNAYEKTSIYNTTQVSAQKIESLKDYVVAEVLTEEPQENTTGMDVLIIVGRDFSL